MNMRYKLTSEFHSARAVPMSLFRIILLI